MKSLLFLHGLSDFPADRFDVTKVEFPIAQTRGANAQKRNVAVQNGILGVRCSMQAASGMALGDEISHSWFDDRTAACLRRFDLRRAQVDTDYLVPLVCEAGRGDSAHIAKPEDANRWTHRDTLFPLWRTARTVWATVAAIFGGSGAHFPAARRPRCVSRSFFNDIDAVRNSQSSRNLRPQGPR